MAERRGGGISTQHNTIHNTTRIITQHTNTTQTTYHKTTHMPSIHMQHAQGEKPTTTPTRSTKPRTGLAFVACALACVCRPNPHFTVLHDAGPACPDCALGQRQKVGQGANKKQPRGESRTRVQQQSKPTLEREAGSRSEGQTDATARRNAEREAAPLTCLCVLPCPQLWLQSCCLPSILRVALPCALLSATWCLTLCLFLRRDRPMGCVALLLAGGRPMPAICVCSCLRNIRTHVCLQLTSSPRLSYTCIVLALRFRSLRLKRLQPNECKAFQKTTELSSGWVLGVAFLALAYTDGFLFARQEPGRVRHVRRARQCCLHWAPLFFGHVPRSCLRPHPLAMYSAKATKQLRCFSCDIPTSWRCHLLNNGGHLVRELPSTLACWSTYARRR